MAERLKAPVLKTGVGKPTVGSNPTLPATNYKGLLVNRVSKVCPKCGWDDILFEYKAVGTVIATINDKHKLFEGYGSYTEDTIYGIPDFILERECLRCHCRTCHYEWVVDTIDNN